MANAMQHAQRIKSSIPRFMDGVVMIEIYPRIYGSVNGGEGTIFGV